MTSPYVSTSNILLVEERHERYLLEELLRRLQEKKALKFEELATLYIRATPQRTIPLSIFSRNLHPAEALCKYLKEDEKLSYKQIAILLSRNQKSIWGTYHRALQRGKQSFSPTQETFFIPLSILAQRKKSLLESIVLYLTTTYLLSVPAIAEHLRSTPASVRILLTRARSKHD